MVILAMVVVPGSQVHALPAGETSPGDLDASILTDPDPEDLPDGGRDMVRLALPKNLTR